jgi:hypothetical protein
MAGVHVNKYAGEGQYSSQGSKYARKRGQRVAVKPTAQHHRVLELMHARGLTLPEAQAEIASLKRAEVLQRKEQALQTAREKTEGWRKESGLNGSQNGGKG